MTERSLRITSTSNYQNIKVKRSKLKYGHLRIYKEYILESQKSNSILSSIAMQKLQIFILIIILSFCSSQTTPNKIPINNFCPRTLRVRLRDLPKPYASVSASKSPIVVTRPTGAKLDVPAGFQVNIFGQGFDMPRWLALTPTGDILVTETYLNQIRLLRDTDGDGVADVNEIFAGSDNGLNMPFGMAFVGGYFYVGNTNEVRRYNYTNGQQNISGTGEKIIDLPGGGNHWTRNVKVSPDGTKLFVNVGSSSNVEVGEPLPRATVMRMNLDGSGNETWGSGIRNPTGGAFHPVTGDYYVVVNERDDLGDDLVPDYLTRVEEGDFYGWPYAYLSPNNVDPRITDASGQSLRPDLVAETKTPDVLFQAHSAPLGLEFYSGKTFPKRYRHGAFVAFRGSWNRNSGTGYKIVFVPFGKNNRPLGSYQDFLKGFLIQPRVPETWGRPVGLLTLPDGSLIFTDEPNGIIYRIQYKG